MEMNSDWIGWNIYTEQKKTGWYLCTVEDVGGRFVMPLYCHEYPPGNFCWEGKASGEIIAVCPFPKPYDGPSRKEIVDEINAIF